MELLAVIKGLEALKSLNQQVTVYSDSKYVVDAVEKKWVFGWVTKNFKDKKNKDLWVKFYNLYKQHQVKFVWVKGHADNEYNNRCDVLATTAADGRNLLVDEGYEMDINHLNL